MIRILLVDDEYPQRAYMRKIIDWQAYGCTIVGEASNGTEAISQVDLLKPDVIFLDIDMPTMNGLSFLKHLNEQKSSIKTVIVSGHNKFDYACQAMSHGAKLYLLKPIAKVELQGVLEEIITVIKEEQHKMQQMIHLYDQLDETLPLLKQQLLERLLSGHTKNPIESLEHLDLLTINPCSAQLRVLVMEYDNSQYSHSQPIQEIHHAFEQASNTYLHHYTYDAYMSDLHHYILIMDISTNKTEQLMKHLADLMTPIHKITDRPLTIGCSGIHSIDTLHEAYDEALHILQYKTALGTNGVLCYDDFQLVHQPYMALNPQDKNQLTTYLTCKDLPQLLNQVKHIYDHYSASRSTMTDLRMISSELITIGITYLSSLGYAPSHVFGERYHPLTPLIGYNSLTGIRQHVMDFYESIHAFVKEMEQPKLNHVIKDAIAYIEKNYNDSSMSLENIASALYVHPVYLSSLFKKSVHKTISRYILDLRMEKAMDMIKKEQEISVRKVATLIGYDNPYYFSKVFKKYYGGSPSEIRKNINLK